MERNKLSPKKANCKQTETKSSSRALKVLVILKRFSDSDHKLTQAIIMKHLREDFNNDCSCDEKTLAVTIRDIIEEINPKKLTPDNRDHFVIRYNGWDKSDELPQRITGIYYKPVIDANEAQRLVEGVQKLDDLSREAKKKILSKLKEEYKVSIEAANVAAFSVDDNEAIAQNTDIILNAIKADRQISFHFGGYYFSGKTANIKAENGEPKLYTVNPYYIVNYHGKRYMLCNTVPHDDVSIYRVDLMRDIVVMEKNRRFIDEMREFAESKDPQIFMSRHLNMMYGLPITVTLKVHREYFTLIHDYFGNDYEFVRHIDNEFDEIRVKSSEKGIIDLAMTEPEKVEIIRPFKFRDKLKERAKELLNKYK